MATYTLITGASSGLGKELAVQCARQNMNLILLALPGGNIHALAESIRQQYGVEVQVFELDLTNSVELDDTVARITESWQVDFLINNAGIGGTASITDTSFETMDRIIQLNVRSMVMLTRLLLPHMLKNKASRIMNVSSMAAFVPIAYKTVYPASKAFISFFSLGLREELREKGMSVSVLYPGPIMTNYNTSERILSQGFKAKIGLLSTTDIARTAIKEAVSGKATIIPGLFNKINHLLMSILPLDFQLRVVSEQVKNEMKFAMTA